MTTYTLNTGTTMPYGYSTNTTNLSPFPQTMDLSGGINLTVTTAIGGWVVQINRGKIGEYHSPQLYIISQEQDLGVELGKIITIDCLKT